MQIVGRISLSLFTKSMRSCSRTLILERTAMRYPITRAVMFMLLLILLARPAHTGGAQNNQARIKIDIDRANGEVKPHLFGNIAEHLGRMIYGGIYEEGSPLSDSQGYRKDVMEAVRKLNVSILRWPGGNFSSGYNWTDGIGPRDQRPVRADLAWHALEPNRFGTD